jgi:L-2-hydroxyglutarate oxidase LhgO
VRALAGAAQAGGAKLIGSARASSGDAGSLGEAPRAHEARARGGGLECRVSSRPASACTCCAAVNCAGCTRTSSRGCAGDDLVRCTRARASSWSSRRRRDPPLEQILLPVPSALGKGVLVFPTLDRRAVIAGPTAREREDKRDWSVEPMPAS